MALPCLMVRYAQLMMYARMLNVVQMALHV